MDISEGRVKRLKNLPAFKGWTDEQLRSYLENKVPKDKKKKVIEVIPSTPEQEYQKRYDKKMAQFRDEYGVDMNDANDAESLRTLVRLIIQLEDIDKQIRDITSLKSYDTKQLKDLADYQKGLVQSVSELQEKLGITRKARKEKQVDDIPQYLKEIRRKAKDYWQRTTSPIRCEKCQIELARYWLNFPQLANTASFELECWKCGEKVVYVR